MKRWLASAVALVAFIAIWSMGPPSRAGGTPGESCMDCHEQEFIPDFGKTPHGKLADGDWFGAAQACASCHGPADKHMEEADPDLIRTFPGPSPEEDAAVCLKCHASSHNLGAWNAGEHAMAGVTCIDCHQIHPGAGQPGHDPRLGHRAADNPYRRCFDCHPEVQAQIHMPSHHPIPEGKMNCGSCHDPHGLTEGLLKTQFRKNDVCLDCHPAMQGPHVFQHDPVEEDCTICHSPHGAPADNLLTQTEPFLCLQCHEAHFHAALGGAEGAADTNPLAGYTFGTVTNPGGPLRRIEVDNPFGALGMKKSFLTKCTQCHVAVHGSDTPSAGISGGGRAMTR